MDKTTENNLDNECAIDLSGENPATDKILNDENTLLIAKLEEEILSLKDKMLRNAAEADNLRKRLEKQIEDTAKYSISSFASDLINVVENFFRAFDNFNVNGELDDNFKTFYSGIELTKKELVSLLEKNGIKRINPTSGELFDHNLHQAVTRVPNPELETGTIASVMQAGYVISDRLLRPAMVAVVAN